VSVFEIEVADHVALLRFNRPDVMNAMSPEVLVRMLAAWERVRDDAEIRVAIITGAGDRAFCSGADLGRLIPLLTGARSAEDDYDRALLADPTIPGRASLRDMDAGKPVIAAVNGYCLAGGMEFLQGTDIRVASSTAHFGLKEVQRGLIASGGSCARLARQVPFVHAMEILLTGETITAAKALEIGLINGDAAHGPGRGRARTLRAGGHQGRFQRASWRGRRAGACHPRPSAPALPGHGGIA